jgi:putrescine transport system ATP-binding protein
MTLSDRIAVMNAGKLAQVASPAEIYENPNSRWVADFIGDVSLIEGRFSAPGLMQTGVGELRARQNGAALGETAWLALRPEKIALARARPDGEVNALAGTVAEVGYRGDHSIYKVRLADRSVMQVLVANTGAGNSFAAGDVAWLSWPPESGVVVTK